MYAFSQSPQSQNASYIIEEDSCEDTLNFREDYLTPDNSRKVLENFSNNPIKFIDSPNQSRDYSSIDKYNRVGISDELDSMFWRTLYLDTRYGKLHKRNSSRIWPQSISCITRTSNIEDMKFHKTAEDVSKYKVNIKTIKDNSEKKKMRQSRILMNIIQNRINKEMMTWTCIPNIISSLKVDDIDKRFKVLKPKFDKKYIIPKITSLFTVSRELSRKKLSCEAS